MTTACQSLPDDGIYEYDESSSYANLLLFYKSVFKTVHVKISTSYTAETIYKNITKKLRCGVQLRHPKEKFNWNLAYKFRMTTF